MTPLVALALLAGSADTLVVGLLADPVSLDPHRATDLVSAAIVSNVCETLVRYRPAGSHPEAALATTWATNDGRNWTFTLREKVRFHDGTPLDADAVVANVEALRRERGFPGRAQRIGPLVVAVSLDKPSAALLATLSQPAYSLQSAAQLREVHATPVGTGPFRMVSAQPGRVELAANESYWGGPPRIAHLQFRKFPDEAALVAALLAGEVDVTGAIGQDRVAQLREAGEVTLDSQTGLNLAFLSLNNERAPLSDVRVRQALARAVDRDGLVAGILGHHGVPARNPLPPLLFGYGTHTKELILDRPAARRLLAQAGMPDGFETSLLTVDSPRSYLPSPLALARRLRDDLAQVGVRVKVTQAPNWSDYVARGSRGDYDMMTLGWQADTTDPNDFLSALLGSESIGGTNRSRYHSDAMDALLKRGRMAGDPGERLGVYREAQQLFQRDMPWIPLYHVSVFTAYRRSIHDLAPGPTGILRYDKAWRTP